MRYTSLLATLVVPALFACATNEPDIAPAPGAQPAPGGPGQGAVAFDAGVRIEARSDAWRGLPENLENESIPLLVEITNESGRPLLIRYDEFELVDPAGTEYHAIPPFHVEGEVSQRVYSPAFGYYRFGVAPHLARYYPAIDPYYGHFYYDPFYYDTYYPAFAEIELPTADMIALGIPEGVVEPNGRLSGFLYFEDVEDLDIDRVMFRVRLVDAETNEAFGSIEIPFVVQ